MNVDDRGREAAVALLTRTTDGLDVDAELRTLHGRAEPAANSSRPRIGVAAAIAFGAVVVIVGGVVAIVFALSGGSNDGQPPTTSVVPKDVVGYVPTADLPHGFHATEMQKLDQQGEAGGTTFRTVVYLEHPTSGGHFVAVLVSRNPFNGILKDEPPDVGRTLPDPFTGKTALAWTRAPYWELQVSGDVPIAELLRVANGVSVPADANATVDDATFSAPPVGFQAIYDGSSTAGVTQLRSITYSRAYGSRPAVTISTESGSRLSDFTRLQVVRVRGRDAILHTGRDQFGNRVYVLVFHERHDRDTTVATTGLTRAEMLDIAEHMKPVTDSGWGRAAHGVRPSDAFGIPLLTPPTVNRGVTIASYSTPEGPLDAVFDTVTRDGFRWTCLEVRDAPGSFSSQCTDPATGFAFPSVIGATVTGTTRFVNLVTGSYGRNVASVRVTHSGELVPVTVYDTRTGTKPKLFVAFVPADAKPARVTALDARGHVVQRATVGPGGAFVLRRG